MTRPARRGRLALLAVAAFALVVLLGAPLVGLKAIAPAAALRPAAESVDALVLWRLRVPRVCIAFLAGAGLAASGMVFQAMFRNPLATPFTLGVASGASLGAALAVRLGVALSLLGVTGTSLCAFGGALVAVLIVYGLARARGGFSAATLLLAGVAVSFFFSSLILFVQYISNVTDSKRILHWVMGSVTTVGYGEVLSVLPFVVCGIAAVLYLAHELNLLATGEDLATSRGVDVPRTKHALFFVTSLMVGGVVAVCGPVGFVGMMAPHICRLLVGPDHRRLAPATILFGGAFLVLCDAIARTVIAPAEMPVGIITALLGGPFFIWLLVSRAARRGLF